LRFIALSAVVFAHFTGFSPPRLVTVTGFDYAFTAPDTLPAGATTFRFLDKGTVDHHFILFRIEAGVSLSDFHRAMAGGGPTPAGIASLGGLQSDKTYKRFAITDAAARQQSRDLTVVLKPGRYVLACLHAEDGVSHLQKGMMRELAVVKTRHPAPSPLWDATLDMRDYGYLLSRPLTGGRRTIRITNSGPQEHHIFIQRMQPGKGLADVRAHQATRARERATALSDSGSRSAPPMTPVTAITRMSPGEEVFMTLDLVAGDYRLFCIVPDSRDQRPHTQHGMDQLISVR
jgi:hypothetical protein